MIKLEPLLRFTNPVTVQPIGHTPFGERTTYIVGEGVFTGPRLRRPDSCRRRRLVRPRRE